MVELWSFCPMPDEFIEVCGALVFAGWKFVRVRCIVEVFGYC